MLLLMMPNASKMKPGLSVLHGFNQHNSGKHVCFGLLFCFILFFLFCYWKQIVSKFLKAERTKEGRTRDPYETTNKINLKCLFCTFCFVFYCKNLPVLRKHLLELVRGENVSLKCSLEEFNWTLTGRAHISQKVGELIDLFCPQT